VNNTEPIPNVDDPCSSRAVAWWPVLTYIADLLRVDPAAVPEAAQRVPLLGTPAWCALPDDAPAKLAAVLHGGCHHALRLEMTQEAAAEASKAISAATDWRAVASELSGLAAYRKANPWARRVAS
jgi:hypothetical protein